MVMAEEGSQDMGAIGSHGRLERHGSHDGGPRGTEPRRLRGSSSSARAPRPRRKRWGAAEQGQEVLPSRGLLPMRTGGCCPLLRMRTRRHGSDGVPNKLAGRLRACSCSCLHQWLRAIDGVPYGHGLP